MLKKTLPIVALATLGLLALPAAAAVVTVSTVQVAAEKVTERAASVGSAEVAPAVWIWAATGALGVAGMVGFGATVGRRKDTDTRTELAPVTRLEVNPQPVTQQLQYG